MALVTDQGRTLAEQLPPGFAWSYREQLATALMYRAAQAAGDVVLDAAGQGGVLLCDGTAATPAVWHLCAIRRRPHYDAGPQQATHELLQLAVRTSFDLVLLLSPDVQWEADGIRDDPQGREEAFGQYQAIYPKAHVIAGPDRFDQARAALKDLLRNR